MAASSDFRINSQVRSLLARHWIDLKKIQIGSFRGTVRITGELSRLGGEGCPPYEPHLIETLEMEIRALADVERVYIEATNWIRAGSGHWTCKDAVAHTGASATTSSGESQSLVVETKANAAAAGARGGGS